MPSGDLQSKAIQEALKGNWEEAIKHNIDVLKEFPQDTDTLNRLAKAYKESGEIEKCIKTLKKILRIDRYNTIAKKNLKRIEESTVKGKKIVKESAGETSSCVFLEEPGKTKIIHLLNLAPKSVLSSISPLDKVIILPKRRTIQIINEEGKYIGALPDDLSKRLTTLISGGNKYEAFIKSADKKEVIIFIRETKRSNKFKNQPSFLNRTKDILADESDEKIKDEENEEEDPSNSLPKISLTSTFGASVSE